MGSAGVGHLFSLPLLQLPLITMTELDKTLTILDGWADKAPLETNREIRMIGSVLGMHLHPRTGRSREPAL